MVKLSDEKIARLKQVLSEHDTVADAARAVGMQSNTLTNVFTRRGDSATRYLKEPKDPDPVIAFGQKRDASTIRRERDNLLDLLRVEREKNAFYSRLAAAKADPVIVRREIKSGLREMTALVAASDWHPEERVDPVKVHGLNEFNLTIAAKRIDRFFAGIVDLVEHHRASGRIAIRDLILWLGGDLITGYIHEELIETNELSPIETILWLTPKIRSGIATLVDKLDLDSIVLPCDVGNHGRTTKFRRISTGCENSFEWGMYCQLAREFEGDDRVKFDHSAANDHYVKVYDYTLHTTHGDCINYGGGIGGLTIPLLKAVGSWDTTRRADWHMIGHWHQFLDVDKAIVNGSLIGWGAYSAWIKAKYNPRDLSQHFSLIDSKRGRCHTTPIWVGK